MILVEMPQCLWKSCDRRVTGSNDNCEQNDIVRDVGVLSYDEMVTKIIYLQKTQIIYDI